MTTALRRIRPALHKALSVPAVRCILLSAVLSFFIEVLNQRSLVTACTRLVTEPTLQIYNFMLVLAVVSLSGMFRRQYFAMVVFALPWLVVSIANFVLQCFRNTPLSAVDFKIIFSVIPIINVYLTPWQIVLLLAAIAAAIALLVLLFLKSGKQPLFPRSSAALTVLCALLLAILTPLLLQRGTLSNSYSNLTRAYRDYGLPYCFLVSVLDRGIDEPETYSEDSVEQILDQIDAALEETDDPAPSSKLDEVDTFLQAESAAQPNVIFLQLESFIDVNYLSALTFSEDPVPYFRSLKEQYPSGFLTVPTYGAGTVNTEFEVLTGMNLDNFGAGEYPFISVLRDRTCESVAYDLSGDGYTATVIHNNTATFYDRNLVYANLGFDRFVSSEYMYNLDYTSVGWIKDNCLTSEITRALTASDGPDLIYTISVQPHGKYPTELDSSQPIQITGGFTEEQADQLAAYTYYVNQLREVDDFLRTLTKTLDEYDEPVLLVAYGDHLPNFELDESEVQTGDLFQTEYVLWSNYDLEAGDCDLAAYRLSSYVLGLFDCDCGVMTRYHQTFCSEDNYLDGLELLEYDMLYGDMSAWDGENPYLPTQLQLGYGDIRVEEIACIGEQLYVTGRGFNPSSVVCYDGEPVDTVYINHNTLCVTDQLPEAGMTVSAAQIASDGLMLSETNSLLITEAALAPQPAREAPVTDDPDRN